MLSHRFGVNRRGSGCRAEAALDGTASYSVDAMLGRRGEPALDLAARRLAEELSAAGCRRCARAGHSQLCALHTLAGEGANAPSRSSTEAMQTPRRHARGPVEPAPQRRGAACARACAFT